MCSELNIIIGVTLTLCMCEVKGHFVMCILHSCVSWEADERPPLADVLTSLVDLLPPTIVPPRISEKHAQFVHSNRSVVAHAPTNCMQCMLYSLLALGLSF